MLLSNLWSGMHYVHSHCFWYIVGYVPQPITIERADIYTLPCHLAKCIYSVTQFMSRLSSLTALAVCRHISSSQFPLRWVLLAGWTKKSFYYLTNWWRRYDTIEESLTWTQKVSVISLIVAEWNIITECWSVVQSVVRWSRSILSV